MRLDFFGLLQNKALKSVFRTGMVLPLAISLLSACSLQKPTKSNASPDVVVVNAPAGDVLSNQEIRVQYEPEDNRVLNNYRVNLSWPANPSEVTLTFSVGDGKSDQRISVDASKTQQASFSCDGGQSASVIVLSVSKESRKNATFSIPIRCPKDLRVTESILPTQSDYLAKLRELQNTTGILLIENGITIDLGENSLQIQANEISASPQITIIANRARSKKGIDHKYLPRSLSSPRSSSPETLSLKSGGQPLIEALTANTKLDSYTKFSLSEVFSLGELDSVSAKDWLLDQDKNSAQIKIKAKFATGSLRLFLVGEEGQDGQSGDELAKNSKAYQSLLALNKAESGKPGEPGKSHQACRKQLDGQYCEDRCIQKPTSGTAGSDAIIPGLDGQTGTDGMPTPAAEVLIEYPSGFNIIANYQPGHGGKTGLAGKGQSGGSGGAPGSAPATCPAASPGPAGKSAPSGLTPQATAADGWCSPIKVNKALLDKVSTQTTRQADDLCREQRNDLIQIF